MSVESSTSFISGKDMPDMGGAFPKASTPLWKNPIKHWQEKNASVQAVHWLAMHGLNQREGMLHHQAMAGHQASITPEGQEFYVETPFGRTRGFGQMKAEPQLNSNQFSGQDSAPTQKRAPVWDPSHPAYPKAAPGQPESAIAPMSNADKARADLLREKVAVNRRQRSSLPTPVNVLPSGQTIPMSSAANAAQRGPRSNSAGTRNPGKSTGQGFSNSPVGEATQLTPAQKGAATKAKNKAAAAKAVAKGKK